MSLQKKVVLEAKYHQGLGLLQGFQQSLRLSSGDNAYFSGLFHQFLFPTSSAGLVIGQNFFPTAMLTPEETKAVGFFQLSELEAALQGKELPKDIEVSFNPMDGGIGSSLDRKSSILELIAAGKVQRLAKNGAKSTDTYFIIKNSDSQVFYVNVFELKLLQAILMKQRGVFDKVNMDLLISTETNEVIEELLKSPCLLDKLSGNPDPRSYEKLLQDEGLNINFFMQAALPTVDKNGELTSERVAPGSHGQWGVGELINILDNPTADHQAIAVVHNGDGVNNGMDTVIPQHMALHKLPAVMVMTEKTGLDLKGGQPGVVRLPNGRSYTDMMEAADAKNAGQLDLFIALGLTEGRVGGASFNTNTVLFNRTELSKFLKRLVGDGTIAGIITRDEFVSAISPTLTKNPKDQGGKTFVQLEGTIGSVMLTFNKYLMLSDNPQIKALLEEFGYEKGLLTFVQAAKEDRERVFSPVKNAIDVVLQTKSDLFVLDQKTYELKRTTTKALPSITVEASGVDIGIKNRFDNVEFALKAFGNPMMQELDSLTIKGRVLLPNAVLKGEIIIQNHSEHEVDLSPLTIFKRDNAGRIVLDNVRIVIGTDGQVKVFNLIEEKAAQLEARINSTPVLVVDDQHAERMAKRMEKTGFTSVLHITGADQLDSLFADGFEGGLVVLDFDLGESASGPQVAMQIAKRLTGNQKIMVAFWSAHDQEYLAEQLMIMKELYRITYIGSMHKNSDNPQGDARELLRKHYASASN